MEHVFAFILLTPTILLTQDVYQAYSSLDPFLLLKCSLRINWLKRGSQVREISKWKVFIAHKFPVEDEVGIIYSSES